MRSKVLVLVAAGVAWSAVTFGDPLDKSAVTATTRQLFDKGAWKDAVAEANRLIHAHPKDAAPHVELAQLLVNMGLGEAARREARLAVQLQPNDASTHVALGWTLSHDVFGRSYAPGSDRAAALAEVEKARKLDPKYALAAGELGNLFAHGDNGKLWGRGSDAKAAATAKRAEYDLAPTADSSTELLKALLHAGDFAGAEQLAKTAPRSDDRDALWLAAIAGHSTAAAAIRAAATLGSEKAKKHALGVASTTLFALRRYDDARAFYAELGAFGPETPQGAVIAHLGVRDRPLDRKTPIGTAVEAEVAFVRGDKQQAMWDAKTEAELALAWHEQQSRLPDPLPDDVLVDIERSAMTNRVEGGKNAWRIELSSTEKPEVLYAADDRGTLKLIGAAANPHGLGRHALRLIANNDLETARRLLDWAGKDARTNPMFAMVWGPNHGTDREAVELAAAVLTDTTDPDHVRPIVESCAGAPPNGDIACTLVLADISNVRGAWNDTIALLTARLSAHPKEPITARMLAFTLAMAGRPKEADGALRDLGTPTDPGFAKLRMEIAAANNDMPSAIQLAEAATKTKHVTSAELNLLAWLEVVTNTRLSDAIATAAEAVRLDASADALHTKALAELEFGDLGNAVEDGQTAISKRLHGTPTNGDWYLHGRLAELLGFPDDAIAAYQQVKSRSVRLSAVPATDTLAKRRLSALGKP